MRLLADESIESEIVAALREGGFDVSDIKELDPGIDDNAVLATAENSNSILLTYDKDFGELVFREQLASNGVILLRLRKLPLAEKIERIFGVLSEHEHELAGSFTVISLGGLRIRKNFEPTSF